MSTSTITSGTGGASGKRNQALSTHSQPNNSLLRQVWKERISYLFILPAFLGYFIFFAYPVVFAFIASFTRYDAFTMQALPNIFDNYHRAIVRDPITRQALLNVFKYVLITLFVGQGAALTLAMALNSLARGVAFFRTIYYFPVVTSVVTIATIFKWLFGGDRYAPVNQILKSMFGMEPVRWLWEAELVIPIIAAVAIWLGMGFNTIIWMAGLKAIPNEYYEVAMIDGASSWRQFWSITLPLLKPVIIFQTVMGFIGGMKEFGLPLVLTAGGPGFASTTPSLLIYVYGFQQFQMGYASAIAFLLTFLLIAASLVQFRLYGKTESYE